MKKKVLFLVLCFVAAEAFCTRVSVRLSDLGIDTSKMLKNELCTALNSDGSKQVVFKKREQQPEVIVLHYTAGFSVNNAIDTFYSNGTSSHYIVGSFIGDDKGIYLLVDSSCTAFHAGRSSYGEFYSGSSSHPEFINTLNYCSYGIEIVNLGYDENSGPRYNTAKLAFGNTVKIVGSNHSWFPYSPGQVEASALLTVALQSESKIPGFRVLTHGDITDRKVDTGPMYPYEHVHKAYGAGFFRDRSRQVDLSLFKEMTDKDYTSIIRAIGYRHEKDPDLVRAFQMHHSSENISGMVEDPTKIAVLQHAIDLYGHVDPHTGSKDVYFIEEFDKLRQNDPSAFAGFNEYIKQ